MDWQAVAGIGVPTIVLIFFAGKQTQILKFLVKGFHDHEKRLRDGGL